MANTIFNNLQFFVQGDGAALTAVFNLGFSPTSVTLVSAIVLATSVDVSSNVASVILTGSTVTVNFTAAFSTLIMIVFNAVGTTQTTNCNLTSGIYNSTAPTLVTGQSQAQQSDSAGSQYVNTEVRKASYSANSIFTPVAGDIAVLSGSATKTIRVTRVEVSMSTSGTAAYESVQLIKRSTADTAGTSAAMTAVPHDSAFAAASAAPLRYTAAPTLGTAVGTIRGAQVYDPSGVSALSPNVVTWPFGDRAGAVVLRGVAQQLSVNLGAVVATQTVSVTFEWTEE
jgi:hypothetical protein